MFHHWRPYVSVAERRRKAEKKAQSMQKSGSKLCPITIAGNKIASTFWGKAWCENLERYSDYENRLPRGRSYVRNGLVVDLQISQGEIKALVSGSSLYKVNIKIRTIADKKWKGIVGQCAGKIDSLVELIEGKLAAGVMEVITRKGEGLFPAPNEIELNCSCPDWATMCKHVAATFYGVGARLDKEPELLFLLRHVDHHDLIVAASSQALPKAKKSGQKFSDKEMSNLFGIEIETGEPPLVSDKKRVTGKEIKEKPKRQKAQSKVRGKIKSKPGRKKSPLPRKLPLEPPAL